MKWTHIIIHHTASQDTDGANAGGIRNYHVNDRGWRDIGYHFLVERVAGDYEAIVGRPLHMQGAHAPGYNSKGIGVAFVGDFTNHAPPTEQLVVAVSRIIRPMTILFNIPPENILGHRDTKATACPGDSFDVGIIREML